MAGPCRRRGRVLAMAVEVEGVDVARATEAGTPRCHGLSDASCRPRGRDGEAELNWGEEVGGHAMGGSLVTMGAWRISHGWIEKIHRQRQ